MENVFIMDHPLIQHKISMLRNKNTGTNEFRKLIEEIAVLMGYEALRDLPLEEVEVETPIETCMTPMIYGKKLAVVPVLRAGLGMVNGITTLVPSAKIGHIGLYRDPETHEPHEYYCKLPDPIEQRLIVVTDPMLATGGSAVDAVRMIKEHGGKNIKCMFVIAAPQGLERLHKEHPDVQIYVGHRDLAMQVTVFSELFNYDIEEAKRMTKEKLALEVIDRLKKEYPDAGCTLDYDQAWKLLVSVRLAAQCTDARVNVVVEDLYAKYPDVASLAAAEPEEIEAIVRPCGLGKSKARDISACMRILHEQYADNVPTTFEELLKLPGVGRKSANLIMGDVFGKPAIVTDTHCIRLCNRIGLVDGIKEPKKVEMALWKIIPPEEGSDFCHRLVYHGREVCTARTKPYCDRCCLADICAKNISDVK